MANRTALWKLSASFRVLELHVFTSFFKNQFSFVLVFVLV